VIMAGIMDSKYGLGTWQVLHEAFIGSDDIC
jgi:hypothetical protein